MTALSSTRRVCGSLLAAVSVLAGYPGTTTTTTTASHHVTTSYSVRGDVRALVVTAHVGDVRITGGTVLAVSVTQHVVFRGAAPTVRHRLAAGTLRLDSHCPAGDICTVSYVITVPRAITVRVTDDVGAVRLSALAGPVTVAVDAGQIDLSSLSGPLQATTRAGSIIGRNMSSPRVALRVSTGEIDVSFAAAATAISATTDVGAVILRVPDNVPYHVVTSAGVGHIGVSVTQDTAAPRTITTQTTIGAITIEPAP